MIALGDPVGAGLVDRLAQPGGNVPGMSQMVPELSAERLGLLRNAVPTTSRALVLAYLVDPIAPLQVKAMEQAAQSLGITLLIRDIQGEDDIPPAFDADLREGADGLIVMAESNPRHLSGPRQRAREPASIAGDISLYDAGR